VERVYWLKPFRNHPAVLSAPSKERAGSDLSPRPARGAFSTPRCWMPGTQGKFVAKLRDMYEPDIN